ncbi:hypothetical protein K2X33_01380 [bacterium]|nr:hypothetical protein [bacterium]
MRKFSIIFSILISVFTASAEEESWQPFAFPNAAFEGEIAGIALPTQPVAARLNPAALAFFERDRSFQVANAPMLDGSGYGVSASAAYSAKTFGVSAGYVGEVGAGVTHGFFGGLGGRVGQIGFGASAAKLPGAANFSVDAGVLIPMQKELRFAAVVTNAISAPQLNVGVGMERETFHMELNVRLPPLDQLALGYRFSSALAIYLHRFTIFGAGAYDTASQAVLYNGGLGVWLNAHSSLMAQYSSTQRVTIALATGL